MQDRRIELFFYSDFSARDLRVTHSPVQTPRSALYAEETESN